MNKYNLVLNIGLMDIRYIDTTYDKWIEYVGVHSLADRATCESGLETRKFLIDEKYDFEFKCLKTDEPLKY